jgi:predicted flap endonuclease-1-like 5' DNA nuclease
MAKIIDVEGIGPIYAKKLQKIGIRTTGALLKAGASAAGRKELSDKTDVNPSLILEWVNHVDLFRIKGVGEEYSDLLEEAGVDTVVELAQRNPANLYEKIVATNQERKLVRQIPSASQVEDWVKQAKKLPRVVTY